MVATALMDWVESEPEIADSIDSPSETFVDIPVGAEKVSIDLSGLTAIETQRRLVSHYRIDRSRAIRKAKVAQFESQNGAIYCENCSFNFEFKYGERGAGFIEVHHRVPLAALLPNTVTYLSDLVLLCSNCHRVVHRRQPQLDVETLRAITKE